MAAAQAFSLLLLAVGLSMDAMAVAAAKCLAAPRVRGRDVALLAGTFGGFQALTPLLGLPLAARFGALVEAWDLWIAFGLLTLLGGKMFVEAWRGNDDEDDDGGGDPFALGPVLLLGVAPRIDAFAAGLTLPLLGLPPLLAVAVIGLVTAALSAVGVFLGRRVGAMLGKRLDVLGGLALILISPPRGAVASSRNGIGVDVGSGSRLQSAGSGSGARTGGIAPRPTTASHPTSCTMCPLPPVVMPGARDEGAARTIGVQGCRSHYGLPAPGRPGSRRAR